MGSRQGLGGEANNRNTFWIGPIVGFSKYFRAYKYVERIKEKYVQKMTEQYDNWNKENLMEILELKIANLRWQEGNIEHGGRLIKTIHSEEQRGKKTEEKWAEPKKCVTTLSASNFYNESSRKKGVRERGKKNIHRNICQKLVKFDENH